MEKGRIDSLKETIQSDYETSETAFSDVPEEDREYLKLFAFICNLSFDVYVKKQLIEKLIDELPKEKKKK